MLIIYQKLTNCLEQTQPSVLLIFLTTDNNSDAFLCSGQLANQEHITFKEVKNTHVSDHDSCITIASPHRRRSIVLICTMGYSVVAIMNSDPGSRRRGNGRAFEGVFHLTNLHIDPVLLLIVSSFVIDQRLPLMIFVIPRNLF